MHSKCHLDTYGAKTDGSGAQPGHSILHCLGDSFFGILGKLVYGTLVDRWDVRRALWLGIAFQVAGQILMLIDNNSFAFLFGACLFGFGMGGIVPMQGAVVGAAFGRDSFGKVLGAMRPPMSVIHLLGVPFAGWVFDVSGTYQPAFLTFLGLYVLTGLIVSGIRVETRATHRLTWEDSTS